MTVLITGGAGFIGSHLVELLVSMNRPVLVLDDFSGSDKRDINLNLSNGLVRIIEGSILDQELVENLMQSVSSCFHLGASLGVERINNDSINSLDVNIRGCEIVLQAALKFGVRTLLTSSSEVYGRNPNMPLNEKSDRILGSPKVARWSYSEAKAIDEFYAFELHKKHGFRITIARLFNTVGPRQSGMYGMVLPRFIKAALHNQPLVVYGNGRQSRSFCAVQDVVIALDNLLNNSDCIGQVYNIGSTNEISINDLAQKVIKLTESKSQVIFKSHYEVFGDDFEEPERRVPDISKIMKATGWRPKKSLDKIISEITEYVKVHEV